MFQRRGLLYGATVKLCLLDILSLQYRYPLFCNQQRLNIKVSRKKFSFIFFFFLLFVPPLFGSYLLGFSGILFIVGRIIFP